jgi:hypothetical protein
MFMVISCIDGSLRGAPAPAAIPAPRARAPRSLAALIGEEREPVRDYRPPEDFFENAAGARERP